MITLFDLRNQQDEQTYASIEKLYREPINIVKLEAINPCTGCWSCWLRTPGKCVMKDQITEFYPNYVNSDTVIILIDPAKGFINHQAKAFLDRTIPHYHPYIEVIDGECHHVARYASYPNMVFYYNNEGLTNEEDQVIEDYLYRTAYHFKSKGFRIFDGEGLQLQRLEPRKAKNGRVPFSSMKPMEKLVIYNGSPRRTGSNSTLILKKITDILGDRVEIRDLKKRNHWLEWAEASKSEKHMMIFTPLYVHAMPSHVMEFIEQLPTASGSISFFVQSGFPESSQSHYLEAYFEQLAIRLGRTYLGTAIKGGVEGLQIRPANAQESMMEPIVKTVVHLVDEGKFDETAICQLAKPVRFEGAGKLILTLFMKMGIVNYFFWDKQLKKNDAYEKRFDSPYSSSK